MANSKIVLDRQAVAQTFEFGTSSASGQGLVTIRKGTAAASTVGLAVEGSVTIGGDITLTGNLNITGAVNQTTVTDLYVTDKTIRVNRGGTTAGAAGAGLTVEGDSAAIIGLISYAAGSATKFQIGNGTTQVDIADISTAQTFTNKSISGSQITSAVANATLAATVTTNANLTGIVTSVGNATSIADGAIAIAKLANIATTTLLGRSTAASGPVESIAIGSGLLLSGGTLSSTAGGGTVTSVSVTTANGISGSVATATTTPAITLSLGAITPSSVNGLTLASQAVGFTIAGGTSSKTLTVPLDASVSGTHTGTSSGNNTGDQTITLTGDVTGTGTGSFATTITKYFRPITVTGTQDLSNKVYSLSNAPVAGTEQVFVNGQLQNPGSSNDYVLSSTTLTFQAAFSPLASTDVVRVYGRW